MSKKTTLKTQLLHEISCRDTHEPQGKDVGWIQKQLDVGEELDANAGQEQGGSASTGDRA
jgi:hypothetical protein